VWFGWNNIISLRDGRFYINNRDKRKMPCQQSADNNKVDEFCSWLCQEKIRGGKNEKIHGRR